MEQNPASFAADRVRPLVPALDFRSLVAALSAHQASTRTALVAHRLSERDDPAPALAGALAQIADGKPGWTVAVARLAGHFHAEAARASAAAHTAEDGFDRWSAPGQIS